MQSVLSRGGQGTVYLAIQESTHRQVAIKVPLDDADPHGVGRKRFEREIQLVAQLQHPNIVSVFDAGVTADGRAYFVMDYIRGLPLREYVRRNQMSMESAIGLFRDLCHAVHHAHQRGVIHRDLKPSNVLVTADGVVKVLDFGLAKSLLPAMDTAVSETGQFIGTLAYTAPEQLHGRLDRIDQRSDVYSLGVMLYELLTGRYPFQQTGDFGRLVEQFASAPPTPPRAAWTSVSGIARESDTKSGQRTNPIDSDLETIVLKALAKESGRRYAGAHELAEDLERYLAGKPIAARRDNLAYLITSRMRTAARRYRVTTLVLVLLLSVAIAQLFGVSATFWWTGLGAWYERALTAWAAPPAPADAFADLRIVALTDRTDVAGLAARAGLSGVDPASPRSLRELHGRMMEKLVESDCRAVAWDITFVQPSPHDEAWVRGADALRNADVPVVVGVPTWDLDGRVPLALSPVIARCVIPACIAAGLGSQAPWRLQLCAKRGPGNPQPSLALAAFAAFRNPQARAEFTLDVAERQIAILYYQSGAQTLLPRRLPAIDRVRLTHLLTNDDGSGAHSAGFGLEASDTIGLSQIEVAPTAEFERITIEYAEVFAAGPAQLREWFAKRLVLCADMRSGVDLHAHPDGRTLPGCYAHIASLGGMLAGTPIRATGIWQHVLQLLFAAGLGLIVGVKRATRPVSCWLAVLALLGLVAACSVAAFAWKHYLFNPFPAMLALVCGAALAAWSARLVHDRPG